MKQKLLFKVLFSLAAMLMTANTVQAQEAYAVLSDEGKTVTFYYDTQKENRGGLYLNTRNNSNNPYKSATTAVIDASFADYRPTSTAYWFIACSSLTTITGMENLKTDSVTNMYGMFHSCSSLTSLDISNFKTDSVKNMGGMFYNCSSLTNLDISNFKTDNVTNMSTMFRLCKSLTKINVSGFKTDNVTNMGSMFSECYSLTSLDLSSFNTNSLKSIDQMFSSCYNLETIYVNDEWNTEKLIFSRFVFSYCYNLVGGQATDYDGSHTNYEYARIDGGSEAPGYFSVPGQVPPPRKYVVLSDEGKTVTFYFDTLKENRGGISMKSESSTCPFESATTAVFDASFADYRPTSTDYWFGDCSSLTTITGMENLKTDKVTNMDGMFNNCRSLTGLNLSNFKTDNVEGMSSMFNGCSSLTSLDLSSFKTDNLRYMREMFSGCSALETIYVGEEWNAMNASFNSNSMFAGCFNLVGGKGTEYDDSHTDYVYARIDGGPETPGYLSVLGQIPPRKYAVLSDEGKTVTFYFDTQKESRKGIYINNRNSDINNTPYKDVTTAVIDASFKDCRPTSTANWFGGCSSLTAITGMENLKTDNVTDMSRMFYGCYRLRALDLSGFKTDKVTDMSYMFANCNDMGTIYAGDEWSTVHVSQSNRMFLYCYSLVGDKGTGYDNSHIDRTYARIDGGPEAPGYFSYLPTKPYAVLSNEGQTVTFYYDTHKESRGGIDINEINSWENPYGSATTAVIDASFADYRPTSTAYWFQLCTSLTHIMGIENITTDSVTNMRYMFYGCKKLTKLDISSFKTDEVVNMNSMFNNCSSLTILDLSSFKTDNVKDMAYMFYGCTNLETIYASDGWSTEKVTDSKYMFSGCTSLVGGIGTEYSASASHTNCTYARIDGGAEAPGYFCAPGQVQTLKYAVLSEDGQTVTFYYDTQKNIRGGVKIGIQDHEYATASTAVIDASFADYHPTSTEYWFYGCTSLTTITGMENLNTDKVTSMSKMFSGCTSLTTIDLSSFVTDNVRYMDGMFSICSSLTTLDLSSFNTVQVTDMSYMFRGCSKLATLDLSSFVTDNVRYMYEMFNNCSSLTTLDLSSFNTTKVTNMGLMFASCSNLTTIFVGNGWSTNTSKNNSKDMFTNCKSLVGGQGTEYNASYTDYTYARIDGGPENPGYFTEKLPNGISTITTDCFKNTPTYNLSGLRIAIPQKGINIIGGKKVVVK